jgi:hypothetical protein
MRKLLDKLKQYYNIPIESNYINNTDHEIFYYLIKNSIYINCDHDPVNNDILIAYEDYI